MEKNNLKEELSNFHRQKKRIELDIFNTILNQCIKQIKYENEHGKEETYFNIPAFMIGAPVYDISTCNSFILENLKKQGIKCKKICNNLIHISWKNSIDDKQEQTTEGKSKKIIGSSKNNNVYDSDDLKLFSLVNKNKNYDI